MLIILKPQGGHKEGLARRLSKRPLDAAGAEAHRHQAPEGARAFAAPGGGRSPLTYVLLVVLALGGHGLLWRAVQAAVRATVPKAVCLLGRPVPRQGTYGAS